jgi:hypothetical protein
MDRRRRRIFSHNDSRHNGRHLYVHGFCNWQSIRYTGGLQHIHRDRELTRFHRPKHVGPSLTEGPTCFAVAMSAALLVACFINGQLFGTTKAKSELL